MSDKVKVGTSKVTFRVRAFDYPQIELASVEVDVPMYTKTDLSSVCFLSRRLRRSSRCSSPTGWQNTSRPHSNPSKSTG